jgi:hypothetical protein
MVERLSSSSDSDHYLFTRSLTQATIRREGSAVDCRDLNSEDLLQVRDFATQFMRDLSGLRDRMAATGFPDVDPLVKCVGNALDAGRLFYLQVDELASGSTQRSVA